MIGTLCTFYFGGVVAAYCQARNLENHEPESEEVRNIVEQYAEDASWIDDLVGAICWPIEVYSYIRRNKN